MQPVVLAGSGRSGTTWLGDALSSARGCCSVFEPLRRTYVPEVPSWSEQSGLPGPYLPVHADSAEWSDFFGKVFDRRISNIWTRQDWRSVPRLLRDRPILERIGYRIARARTTAQLRRGQRVVVKTIRSNLLLTWLQQQFPVQIVYLLRHPCAVVGSRLRLGWSSSLEDIWSQLGLLRDFLEPHRKIIECARTPLEQTAVLWCVENVVPLAQLPSQPWHVCTYEQTADAPEASIAEVFQKLGLEATRSTRKAIAAQVSTPSSTTGRDAAWHAPLSESEGERVLEMCSAFGIRLYGRQRLPLYDPREALSQLTACR